MVHEGVHGAQQMLVGHALGHRRHSDSVQPAQHAQLAVRGTEPVEHHRPHQGLNINLPLAGAQRPSERAVKTKILPDLMQRKDVAVGQGALELNLHLLLDFTPRNTAEATDQGVQAAVLQVVDAPEVGDDAQARLSVRITEGFHDLQVAATAVGRDAREHGMPNIAIRRFTQGAS